MPGKTKPASVADLSSDIPKIFDQAQVTSANHQKNYVALYKLHCEAAQRTEPVQKENRVKLTGERAFEDTFIHMVARVLPVKKGATQIDRVVKFVGGYIKFVNEKGMFAELVWSSLHSPLGSRSCGGNYKEWWRRRRRRRLHRFPVYRPFASFSFERLSRQRQSCSLQSPPAHRRISISPRGN